MHQDVVSTVAHEIFPDRVVLPGQERDAQLRPDAVHARREKLAGRARDAERSREGAEILGHVGVERGADELPDAVDRLLALPDVHARVAVAAHGRRSSTRSESGRAGTSRPESWSSVSAATALRSNCEPAVRAVGGHRVEGVAHVDDARAERDLGILEARGISPAVGTPVVRPHHVGRGAERADLSHDAGARLRMAHHEPPLVRVECRGFPDHLRALGDLSDVVTERGVVDRLDLLLTKAEVTRHTHGVVRHPHGVLVRVGIDGVEHDAQGAHEAHQVSLEIRVELERVPGEEERKHEEEHARNPGRRAHHREEKPEPDRERVPDPSRVLAGARRHDQTHRAGVQHEVEGAREKERQEIPREAGAAQGPARREKCGTRENGGGGIEPGVQRSLSRGSPENQDLRDGGRRQIEEARDPGTEEEDGAQVQDGGNRHRRAADHRDGKGFRGDEEREPDQDSPRVPVGLLHLRAAEDRQEHGKRGEKGRQEEPHDRSPGRRTLARLRLPLDGHHKLGFQSPTQAPSPREWAPPPHGVCQGRHPGTRGQLRAGARRPRAASETGACGPRRRTDGVNEEAAPCCPG